MPDQPAGRPSRPGPGGQGATQRSSEERAAADVTTPTTEPTTRASLLASTAPDVDSLIRKQESLLAFIEAISGELELRPLLTRILRYACELMDADNGTIGLVDATGRQVRTEAVYRMPASEMGATMPVGMGLAGAVLERGGPVVLSRYGDVANPTQPDLAENAVLGMPIVSRGEMIGFFGIGTSPRRGSGEVDRARPFTREDVATLTLFARHAAVAIDNARQYAREQARTERLALIARIGQIITADLRLSDLLERAADAIHELLGYPNVAIPLLDPGGRSELVLRTVGGHYKEIVRGEYRIPLERGIMGAAARERRTQLVNDVHADPRHLPTPGAKGIVAELAVPILLGERVLGVLNVESGEPFTEDDAASLQIIADQLAVAIENAHLYERGRRLAVLEERNRLARDLHDSVTQHIFGMVLIGESLSAAWRRDAATGERRTERLVGLSRSALAEMRSLLRELRPDPEPTSEEGTGIARVQEEGLPAALAALVAELAAERPHVHVDADRYVAQSTDTEEALYRIAQEALANIVKHAQAGTASIVLRTARGRTTLEVIDDGVGIRGGRKLRRRHRDSGGMGLRTMRERAEALGGSLVVAALSKGGTRVVARIPADGGDRR